MIQHTKKSGWINHCVWTTSCRFSLYIPIKVKLSIHLLSAQSPPSFNMLISINRPALVPWLGRKKSFSECEVEVLISEVDARITILFGPLSPGISTKTKKTGLGKHWQVGHWGWGKNPNSSGHKDMVRHQGGRQKKGLCPPEKHWSDGQWRRSRGALPILTRSTRPLSTYQLLPHFAHAFIFWFIWMHADNGLFPYTQGVNNMYIIRNRPTGSLMDWFQVTMDCAYSTQHQIIILIEYWLSRISRQMR